MIDQIDRWWARSQGESFTAGTASTVQMAVAFQPSPNITLAVFHRVIARSYEDAADATTKRAAKRECLHAALHHYLESYAQEAP